MTDKRRSIIHLLTNGACILSKNNTCYNIIHTLHHVVPVSTIDLGLDGSIYKKNLRMKCDLGKS